MRSAHAEYAVQRPSVTSNGTHPALRNSA